jgi:hypothetical protein
VKRIYLALAIYSTIFFLAVGFLGYRFHESQADPWKEWHLQAGVFTAIFICFVHSLIFIHLLGTGLGIKRAIDEHGLDERLKRELYDFKMRAFPPAMGSMIATIATAVLGGSALTGGSVTAHLVLATVALAANVLTFPVVVRELGKNEELLRSVEALVEAKSRGAAANPAAPPAPSQVQPLERHPPTGV